MLRVTSGTLRGFKLQVPKSKAVRPPLEMARQAVFNILGQDLEGFRVVDVFAGSGIMGIEALSRGADAVLFVEKDRAAAACIAGNLEKTRMTERAEIFTGDAFYPARYLAARNEPGRVGRPPFDLVFLDPPFAFLTDPNDRARLKALIADLFASDGLAADATVILRVPKQIPFDETLESAVIDDDRTYGHSRVLFLGRGGEAG